MQDHAERPWNDADELSQRELERRIFHLKTLYDVSQEISFLKDPREILNNLLLMIMGTFGTFQGVSFLINTTGNIVEAVTLRGLDDSFAGDLHRAAAAGGSREQSWAAGIRLFAPEPHGSKARDKAGIMGLLGSRQITIWVPFRVDDSLAGGIGLGEKLSGEPFTADDQELLSTLASQAAVCIGHAKLVAQMKKEENIRTNLARYLSPQVVDQIIRNNVDVNLGGERKEVTVLFADIRNFTTITEKLAPERLIRILNDYFTEMARIIFANQGSVDKFIGDAMVAVFGSLITVESHAEKAVQAATAMMASMAPLNRRWQETYNGFTMDIGIGVNTGKAFLGNIGSPERMEFTVIGDMVNVAARLSGLAKPGQILLSRDTFSNLHQSAFKYLELPPCLVKGKSEEIEVFECICKR